MKDVCLFQQWIEENQYEEQYVKITDSFLYRKLEQHPNIYGVTYYRYYTYKEVLFKFNIRPTKTNL